MPGPLTTNGQLTRRRRHSPSVYMRYVRCGHYTTLLDLGIFINFYCCSTVTNKSSTFSLHNNGITTTTVTITITINKITVLEHSNELCVTSQRCPNFFITIIIIFTSRHMQGTACSAFKDPPAISSCVYPHTCCLLYTSRCV